MASSSAGGGLGSSLLSDEVARGAARSCIAAREPSAALFSFALPTAAVQQPGVMTAPEDYDTILDGIMENVKWGPFRATSGIEIPYYLNVSTNMLDQKVAGKIARLAVDLVETYLRPPSLTAAAAGGPGGGGGGASFQKTVIVGPEMAGGALVAQMAALAGDGVLLPWCDFA
jgi:hypothetical protein